MDIVFTLFIIYIFIKIIFLYHYVNYAVKGILNNIEFEMHAQ